MPPAAAHQYVVLPGGSSSVATPRLARPAVAMVAVILLVSLLFVSRFAPTPPPNLSRPADADGDGDGEEAVPTPEAPEEMAPPVSTVEKEDRHHDFTDLVHDAEQEHETPKAFHSSAPTASAQQPTNTQTGGEAGQDSSPALPSKRTRPQCPTSVPTIQLLFPHVNKAGGRTIEGTFSAIKPATHETGAFVDPVDQIRFSKLSTAMRSRRRNVMFQLVDGHQDTDEIIAITKCRPSGEGCMGQEGSGDPVCQRWIFMLREPLARTLSAFYTVTGRKSDQTTPPKAELGGGVRRHFPCNRGSRAAELMKDLKFTFEDFARLPLEERKQCYPGTANLHTRYLDGEGGRNLPKALHRLSQMHFVGLSEYFGLSMQLLSFELNLDLERYYPVFNENPYPRNLSAVALQALIDMNRLDLELYKAAKTLFWSRVAEMRSSKTWGGSFPWGEDWSRTSSCDRDVWCWDKREPSRAAFGLGSESSSLLGGEKERFVCAPRKGCQLVSPSAQGGLLPPPAVSKSRCVASFFILGARKGGTTSLYNYLAAHPNVRGVLLDKGAQSGETFFFEQHRVRGSAGLVRTRYDEVFYKEFRRSGVVFDPARHLTGESSVGYGPGCSVPTSVSEACGSSVWLFYLVRDPIERMVSQYMMRDRLGTLAAMSDLATLDADARKHLHEFKSSSLFADLQAWVANATRVVKALPGGGITNTVKATNLARRLPAPPCLFPQGDYANMVWSGLYAVHVARWLRLFDANRLMVVPVSYTHLRAHET